MELDNFAAEALFSSDVLDACEAEINEVIDYSIKAGMKRQLDLEGEGEANKPQFKKKKQKRWNHNHRPTAQKKARKKPKD